MKQLGPDARPRNWLRTAAELSEAAGRVEQQLAERFTSAEMVADLAAEDHGPTALRRACALEHAASAIASEIAVDDLEHGERP